MNDLFVKLIELLKGLGVPDPGFWLSQEPIALYQLGKEVSDQAKKVTQIKRPKKLIWRDVDSYSYAPSPIITVYEIFGSDNRYRAVLGNIEISNSCQSLHEAKVLCQKHFDQSVYDLFEDCEG